MPRSICLTHLRWLIGLLGFFLACVGPAKADSWTLPTVETTYSANKLYRLIVRPRDIKSQLGYFEAKVENKQLDPAKLPKGRLERKVNGDWLLVWEVALVNEVAPVDALVSNDGSRVITFDNWHSAGFGDHVLVIYGAGGELVRSFQLTDFMPAFVVDALPRTVSSIRWRSADPVIDQGWLDVPISSSGTPSARSTAFQVHIRLADGQVDAATPDERNRLAGQFCPDHVARVKSINEALAFRRNPLVYPAGKDKAHWQRYQNEVVRRLSIPDGENPSFLFDDNSFELLPAGEYMATEFRETFRKGLMESDTGQPLRWFVARDLDAMVIEVERAAREIEPGELRGLEMRFLTDRQHWPHIETALGASGAKLTLIDVATPIPQREDVLVALPEDRVIDAACKAYAL